MPLKSASHFAIIAAAVSCLLAPACGGGGGASTPTTPPVPQERVVTQGTMNLRDGVDAMRHLGYLDTAVVPFATSGAGLLKVTIDYTYVDTELLPVVYTGSCPVELARVVKCEVVSTQQLARGKPYVVTVASLAAGQYTLAVTNGGMRAEAISYRVTLTN